MARSVSHLTACGYHSPMRNTVALLASLCLILSTAQAAEEPKELPFPKVEGWERSDVRRIPKEQGGGYSLAYDVRTPRMTLTIFVYNRGRDVPDDLGAPIVTREFELSKGALHEAKRRGLYEEIVEEKSDKAKLGTNDKAPSALHARFRMTVKNQALLSDLYVLPHQNSFVKLRITRTSDAEKESQAKLDALLDEVAKTLAD